MANRHYRPGRVRGEAGFTLAEILMASAISSVVLLALYLLYDVNQVTFVKGEQQADLQQNARIAMDRIVRDLRLAGYGFPTGATNCAGFGVPSAISVADTTSITFCADLINASTVIVVDAPATSTILSVQNAGGIQAGNIVYLMNGAVWEQRTVAEVNLAANPNTITLTTATTNAYPSGSQVGRPRLVKYCWYDDPDLDGLAPPAGCGPDANTIYKNAGDGGANQPVANIRNFQVGAAIFLTRLQYFDDNDTATATPENIRRISVTVTIQDAQPGSKARPFMLRAEVRPRNLGL
jgi:prepilin-type N-terminal cleavage/methylation domain-containing protein